ncbi:MAG: ABC transporter ATP-binding protein [Nitrospirota bacterium]|jgi:lipopolysaccharide transport system ATP-binding protein
MSDIAIKAEHLSKRYVIGASRQRFDSISEAITHKVASFLSAKRTSSNVEKNILKALDDVSFEVKKGEAFAIIGHNGSGKSTLLKILSRVTTPSGGSAKIYGRVGSLLEVGTGFHPDLTGRENIYLNGAILGMRKAEIASRFDEIVEFSGVEKFLDTPVKRYSSGMYVRLAFAVAAHLEPEILIVDEVLAVGDAAFQSKCLSKMGDVARRGQTVLLVTHNLGFISTLAARAMVLQRGQMKFIGESSAAISAYLQSTAGNRGSCDLSSHAGRQPGSTPSMTSVRLADKDGLDKQSFSVGGEWLLELEYDCRSDVRLGGAGLFITTATGFDVGSFDTLMCFPPPHRIPSSGKIRFCIPELLLCPGEYFVGVGLMLDQHHAYDWVSRAISFSVETSDIYGTGHMLTPNHGLCAFKGACEIIS